MVTNINGRDINISADMKEVADRLVETAKGRFATIMGYVSKTGYVEPQTADINFTSRFSYENLLKNQMKVLSALNASDVGTTDVAQFESSKNAMMASALKTLLGLREDAHRKAHDLFYVPVCEGVKIHLKTRKVGNDTQLILDASGNPIAESIMVSALEMGRKVVKEGVKKTVNHGPKVLMDKKIMAELKNRGVKSVKTFSLKGDNFDSLRIDSETVTSEEV